MHHKTADERDEQGSSKREAELSCCKQWSAMWEEMANAGNRKSQRKRAERYKKRGTEEGMPGGSGLEERKLQLWPCPHGCVARQLKHSHKHIAIDCWFWRWKSEKILGMLGKDWRRGLCEWRTVASLHDKMTWWQLGWWDSHKQRQIISLVTHLKQH